MAEADMSSWHLPTDALPTTYDEYALDLTLADDAFDEHLKILFEGDEENYDDFAAACGMGPVMPVPEDDALSVPEVAKLTAATLRDLSQNFSTMSLDLGD